MLPVLIIYFLNYKNLHTIIFLFYNEKYISVWHTLNVRINKAPTKNKYTVGYINIPVHLAKP